MPTMAVANQKGGVGKTAVTVCLAAELARVRRRVLIVDLDPQANATRILGVDTSAIPTMADLMLAEDSHGLGEGAVSTEWSVDRSEGGRVGNGCRSRW